MKMIRVIGLTGGVGCGKSAVASIWQQRGIPVLDTDAVAHQLLQSDNEVQKQVIAVFGEAYMNGTAVDRKKLGKRVFSDDEARMKLNAIMHPEIFRVMHRWLEQELTKNERVVVMIPLLFETGAQRWCDKVVTVAADEPVVLQRLARRGWSEQEALARIKAQWPVAEKVKQADAVIWNNGNLDTLTQATMKIWDTMNLGKEDQ